MPPASSARPETDARLSPMEFDDSDDLNAFAFDGDPLAAFTGPAAEAISARRQRLIQTLVEGQTGVQYDALALFAEPLFSLYDLDPTSAFELRSDPDHVPEDVVALLETARVLWAFFSLPPAERGHKRQALAAQLVGEDPTEDDWVDLDGLVDAAEVHWQALLPEEIDAAQTTGHPTLDFDALLHHPAFRVGPEATDATHAGFGPGGLSEVEARALFAQPLLEAPDTMVDGDAFEAALARADAYWALARQRGADVDAGVQTFARETASTDAEARALEVEARQMISRYRDLFPEHS